MELEATLDAIRENRRSSRGLLFSLRGGVGSPRFTASQLWSVLSSYLDDFARRGVDVGEYAESVLSEHARSIEIDEALRQDAIRRQEHEHNPPQLLLIGRSGCGKRTLFAECSSAFETVEAHTVMEGGLQQLCLRVEGTPLKLLDLSRSHANAVSQPNRLRKALQHFDGIDGVIFMVAADELRSAAELRVTADLVAVAAASCGGAGGSQSFKGGSASRVEDGPLRLPFFLLLNKVDLSAELAAAGELQEALPELPHEAGPEELAAEMRAACLSALPPRAAESVAHLSISAAGEWCAEGPAAYGESMAACFASIAAQVR